MREAATFRFASRTHLADRKLFNNGWNFRRRFYQTGWSAVPFPCRNDEGENERTRPIRSAGDIVRNIIVWYGFLPPFDLGRATTALTFPRERNQNHSNVLSPLFFFSFLRIMEKVVLSTRMLQNVTLFFFFFNSDDPIITCIPIRSFNRWHWFFINNIFSLFVEFWKIFSKFSPR